MKNLTAILITLFSFSSFCIAQDNDTIIKENSKTLCVIDLPTGKQILTKHFISDFKKYSKFSYYFKVKSQVTLSIL